MICFYSVPLGSFVCVCVFVYIHTVKVMVSDTSITTVWPDIIISQILDLSLDILSCFPCCNFCSLFINTYIIQCTYLLTAWSRVLIGKLIASQLVKKFLTFYGTQRFITAFTSTCHLSLSWARSIQSMPPPHFLKIHFNIVLPSMPGSSKSHGVHVI